MTDSYRIDVEDFGPIARASVDFRPLTVFVGPSNTGKSYLAILLYALHQYLGGMYPGYHRLGIRRRVSPRFALSMPDSPEFVKSLKDWAAKLSANEPLPALPEIVVETIRSVMEEADWIGDSLTTEIRRCFGVDGLGALIRRYSSSKRGNVSLCVPQKSGSSTLRYELEFNSRDVRISAEIPSLESFSSEMDLPKRLSVFLRKSDLVVIDDPDMADYPDNLGFFLDVELREFISSLFESLIGPAGQNAFYLPADRTGVMHSHQVVVSALVQNASTAGLQPSTHVPVLSGVLADFLSLLIEIGPGRRSGRRTIPRRESTRLGKGLEENLLNGAVLLKSSDAGYPAFTYRPEGWKDDLPLMRASSMVSELAPVVLYLRYIVRPGDVLIIEEPEAHLHPAMQAAFARELARLVHAGVRIVMTTHSEWFLEQIGNLVRLSGLPKAKRRDLESADCALDPEQVGAWLFKPSNRPKGSLVEEVSLDPETGLYPTGYDAVSEALYNEGADIYNRIQERKQK